MLTAYLFDREHGREVETWVDSFGDLTEDEMLWVDLCAPSKDELSQAQEVFGLATEPAPGASGRKARLEQEDGYLVVTAVAISDEEQDVDKERVVLTCYVGAGWLLTVHEADVAVLDTFRETVSGEGESGPWTLPLSLEPARVGRDELPACVRRDRDRPRRVRYRGAAKPEPTARGPDRDADLRAPPCWKTSAGAGSAP